MDESGFWMTAKEKVIDHLERSKRSNKLNMNPGLLKTRVTIVTAVDYQGNWMVDIIELEGRVMKQEKKKAKSMSKAKSGRTAIEELIN